MMKYSPLFIILYFFITFQSCVPETEIYTGGDAQLRFSVDTLRFDTVFTDVGSATRFIRIFNNQDKPIEIQEINLAQGETSKFRLNIDGVAGNTAQSVEIPANDSIYIFAEVTVDPNQPLSVSPFVVEDKIRFLTNGNAQEVVLEAWGQNANYIPNRFGQGGASALTCNGGQVVWDDPKPYVIYGRFFIDECDLVIPAGANIYVHGGLGRYVDTINGLPVPQYYNDGRIRTTSTGKLIIEGTQDNPVTIQGDRLEEGFSEVAGQWYGVVIGRESQGNRFQHVNIKNSVLGAIVDSLGSLMISDAKIYNTSGSAIYGVHSSVRVENSLFYGNGGSAFRGEFGGNYIFRNSTVYSRGEASARAVRLGDYASYDFDGDGEIDATYTNDLNAQIENCILIGSDEDEIDIESLNPATFNYSFENCIVRVNDLLDNYPDFLQDCSNCVEYQTTDALFVDASEQDFHLDTLSIAEGGAQFLPDLPLDLDGNSRDINTPDIGCYEYQY